MLYAHTKTDSSDKMTWQTLNAHLLGVADRAEEGARAFDSGEFARIAAFFHDLGKAAPEFQQYLEDSAANSSDESVKIRCRINHSEAGAALAMEKFGPFWGAAIAYLVAGHHAGLPDYLGDGLASLQNRILSGKKNLDKIRGEIDELFIPSKALIERLKDNKILPPPQIFKSVKDYHLWIRFLFSALVDADRLDTEAFDQPELQATRGKFSLLSELKEKFDAYMERRFGNQSAGSVNKTAARLRTLRDGVLTACREAGREDTGKVRRTLTVPTGGGKTLASLAFALEHAVRYGKRRIIYVIPYTSIIEQTADLFRDIFGAENVVEHHSNFDSERLKQGKGDEETEEFLLLMQKLNQAMENWDAPIIITTNVQFFESLYAAKPGRCRKLHRIPKSVVIFDEAQLLPTAFLSPCVDVLNRLSESYETTLLFSTATQPALTLLKQSNPKAEPLRETFPIIGNAKRLYRELDRVRYEWGDLTQPQSWEETADQLEKCAEVLCIVNTRRGCRELYEEMAAREKRRKGGDGMFGGILEEGEALEDLPETIHLSALMCGEHRSRVIQKIRERLEANRTAANKTPLRVISTQLVEAGVDIDFPVVFRALAGLDSIVQAAGRCNREGRLGPQGGRLRIFTPPQPAPAGLLRKGEEETRSFVRRSCFDPCDPQTFIDYFAHFYAALNSLDEKDILRRLSQNVTGNPKESPDVPFRTVSEDFRLIDDAYSETVFVQYGEGSELIERLRLEGPHRDLMRRLQRFAVNIPKNDFLRLYSEGKFEEIYPKIYVQALPGLYDVIFGLDIFNEGFTGIDLMI